MAGKGNRIRQKRISYDGRARMLKKAHVWSFGARPGSHNSADSIALGVIIRDILKLADNTREVKYILENKTVIVNSRNISDIKYGLGLFDVLEFPEMNLKYRMFYDRKGFADLVSMKKDEPAHRYSKIQMKNTLKGGKEMIALDNGYNISDVKCNVKDTVVYDTKTGKAVSVLPFKVGAKIYVKDGPHTGKVGDIVSVFDASIGKNEEVLVKSHDGEFRTISDYVFVVPKEFVYK